jgi:hypothetical protein
MRLRVIVGLLVIYAVLDWYAVPVWRSEATVWTHAHQINPASDRARVNLLKAQAFQP